MCKKRFIRSFVFFFSISSARWRVLRVDRKRVTHDPQNLYGSRLSCAIASNYSRPLPFLQNKSVRESEVGCSSRLLSVTYLSRRQRLHGARQNLSRVHFHVHQAIGPFYTTPRRLVLLGFVIGGLRSLVRRPQFGASQPTLVFLSIN